MINDQDVTSRYRLFPLCMLMEISWILAWASFLSSTTTSIRFPFSAALSYPAAFAICAAFTRRRLPLWGVIAQLAGSISACCLALTATGHFRLPTGGAVLYQTLLLLFFTLFFWYKGIRCCRRPLNYITICRVFDLGLLFFFLLFLIQLWVQSQEKIVLNTGYPFLLMLLFFLISPLTLAQSYGSRLTASPENLWKRNLLALLLTALLLIISVTASCFFSPALSQVSDSGIDLLQQTTGPLAPYITALFRFLFTPRNMGIGGAGISKGSSGSALTSIDMPQAENGLLSLVIPLFFYLAGAALLFFILYALLKPLFRKRTLPGPPDHMDQGGCLLTRLRHLITFLIQGLRHLFIRPHLNSLRGLKMLTAWGRHSGLPRLSHETPSEYGQRLAENFSLLEEEFSTIITIFHQETYGLKEASEEQLCTLHWALRRMKNPRFWHLRLRHRLLHPGSPSPSHP